MSTRAMILRKFGTPDDMVLEDVQPEEPQADQISIDVRSIGVNFPDLLMIAGEYQALPELPFTPGQEVSGFVKAVGPGVSGFNVGDRVMAQLHYGAYSEGAVAEASKSTVIPKEMSFQEAAGFGVVYLTTYFALVRRARLQAGETVLVTGAGGGVGNAGVQLAKALGAKVIAVSSRDSKRKLALDSGADHAIESDPDSLKQRVRELSGGRGADVVLESVGGDLFKASLRSTAWEGRLVVIGFASGDIPTIKAGHVLVKNISVIGLQTSDYWKDPAAIRGAYDTLLEMYREERIGINISAVYPLEAAAAALKEVSSGRAHGKIVLSNEKTLDPR